MWIWANMYSTLIILWKTLHFGHLSAHMYKVCVCAYTCANTNFLKSKYYVVSVVQTPAKIFIQNCFMAHWCVCVCMCKHMCTYIYIPALQKLGLIQDKKLMWVKNFHHEGPFRMAFCYFAKARFGIIFPLNLFILISNVSNFFRIFFSQNLKSPNTNGRTGIFF